MSATSSCLLVTGLLVLMGCGGSQGGLDGLPEGTSFPHVVTGTLEITVEEGPVGEDDISELNFGELAVDGTTLLVSISGDVVRDSELEREELMSGAVCRITIAGRESVIGAVGVTSYSISRIEPMVVHESRTEGGSPKGEGGATYGGQAGRRRVRPTATQCHVVRKESFAPRFHFPLSRTTSQYVSDETRTIGVLETARPCP